MKNIILLMQMFMVLFLFGPWAANAYKLAKCDFESSYKAEVIRGIGVVVPPFGWVAGWISSDTLGK